jgi:hypothetical protein
MVVHTNIGLCYQTSRPFGKQIEYFFKFMGRQVSIKTWHPNVNKFIYCDSHYKSISPFCTFLGASSTSNLHGTVNMSKKNQQN